MAKADISPWRYSAWGNVLLNFHCTGWCGKAPKLHTDDLSMGVKVTQLWMIHPITILLAEFHINEHWKIQKRCTIFWLHCQDHTL